MAPPSSHPFIVAATADLYRAAIGPQGQDYYLAQFQRFDAKGRAGLGWNGPAFWLTLNWLLYRRMWGWALGYLVALLGLAGLIFGLGRELFDYSYARAVLLFLALLPLSYLIPGLYADAWYYRHCQRKMARALARTDSSAQACQLLQGQAPSQRGLQVLLLANGLVLVLAALWLGGLLGNGDQERTGEVLTAAPASPRASAPAPAAADRPAAPAPASASAPVASAPAIVAPAPGPAASAAALPRQVWVIQVGAYARQSNARQALSRVQALGLEAEAYESRRGRLIRVRVGPFMREDEAEQAARRIRAQQLPALVLRQRS